MENYKKEFIEFMIDCNVLKFGDFVTKSGRKTPFFVNTGFYRTGAQLKRLGEYYAEASNTEFALILTYYLDLHTKEYLLQLPQPCLLQRCLMRTLSTAQTEKK